MNRITVIDPGRLWTGLSWNFSTVKKGEVVKPGCIIYLVGDESPRDSAMKQLIEDELKKYFIHRQDINKWQPNTMRVCYAAIKFFYLYVVQRDWHLLKIIKAPTEKRLPSSRRKT
jgi:hypothetical protein